MDPFSFPIAVVVVAGLVAAITDILKYKVYNVLTLPLLASGVLYHGVVGGTEGVLQSCYGVLFGAGVLILPHLMGGMGSGDLKLLAGIGAWLKLPEVVYVFVVAGLLSAVYSVVATLLNAERRRSIWLDLRVMWQRMALIGRTIAAEDWVETQIEGPRPHQRVIPFAVMLAAGIMTMVIILSLSGHSVAR